MSLNARSPGQAGKPGLLTSLRRLGATVVAVLQTRAELIAREFERERVRVTRLLILGVVGLFFFALGTITFTIFIIVLFWDSQRLVAIGFLTLLYFAIAAGIAIFAKREAARGAKPFSSTIAQLKHDCELLSPRR
jgi:uncharacterized membrane protein YqjE